jgi:acetyl-CoA carboxylase biotin carboxyl carrier protein
MTDDLDDLRRQAEALLTAGRPTRRLRVVEGERSIELEWAEPPAAGPAPAAPAAPGGAPGAPAAGPPGGPPVLDGGPHLERHVLSAPLVGTFYRSPSPGAPPFVRTGDVVVPGQQVAIIEAMKLMNPIEADAAGRVTDIVVADGEPVEYGQPLLTLAPDPA